MTAEITLISMYNFDNTLFDKLQFPDGIDRDLAIKRILNKSEEFELLYSDFDYLKDRIGIWGDIWNRTFTKWIDALKLNYDPLYNYDRYEEYTDTHKRDYKDTQKNTSTSNSTTNTGSTASSGTEQKVSAYESSSYQPNEKEDSTASSTQSGTGSANSNTTNNANGDSNELITHKAHIYGNIGVTTSSKMLEESLKIAEWNLYEHISDIFIDEFCILVY